METLLFATELAAIVILVLGYARTESTTKASERPWLFSYKKDVHDQKSAAVKEET